jgi:5-formyltetrahydrofolate cyclo-ligase
MVDGAEKTHSKSELRQLLRKQRAEKYKTHSLLHIAQIPEVEKAQIIASYFSYGDEPDTRALNQHLVYIGKTLLLPRIKGENLEWVKWDGSAAQISSHSLIPEPIGEAIADTSSIEVVLVPALAMDEEGYRLGQGKGFYDRALKDLSAFTIGIIFPYEILNQSLPRDSWDVPVTLTETTI